MPTILAFSVVTAGISGYMLVLLTGSTCWYHCTHFSSPAKIDECASDFDEPNDAFAVI